MNNKNMKKTFEALLQYGWMWGWPNYISAKEWDNLREFYKTELNKGKEFKPDENNKATAT